MNGVTLRSFYRRKAVFIFFGLDQRRPGAKITPYTKRKAKEKETKANTASAAYLLELPEAGAGTGVGGGALLPAMSVAKSDTVKFAASEASAMQKSQLTLLVMVPVPSSTQHSPTI